MVSGNGLLRMVGEVHRVSNGCRGPVINMALTASRSDHDGFSAQCRGCGAYFGRIPLDKPSPLSVALGLVLAGGSVEQMVNAFAFSDCQIASRRTLTRNLEAVAIAVDEVYEAEMLKHQKAIKEDGRGTIMVPKERHYFAENLARFAHLIVENIKDGGLGIKVGCE